MKKKGISLIVLIITCVVIIILGTAIIVNLAQTNMIDKANQSVVMQDFKTMQEELNLYLSDKFVETLGKFDKQQLSANANSITYTGEGSVEDKNGDGVTNIYDILTSLERSKYKKYVTILEGEIALSDQLDDQIKQWAEEVLTSTRVSVSVGTNTHNIPVVAVDSNGMSLNATSSRVENYTDLLNSMVTNGYATSTDEITAIIDVNADEFEGEAEATFNVSSVAQEGQNVAIYHYDEETQTWELISIEVVDANGTITANFNSFSPIGFKVLTDGLYDANTIKLDTYKKSGMDVEIDYTASNYKTEVTSPYYVLSNVYPTAKIVILPENITKIGAYTFNSCTGLTGIGIPDSITSIGDRGFVGCSALTNMYMPDSVSLLGNHVFHGCTKLSNIKISDNLASIKDYMFYSCKALKSITIPNSVTSIGTMAFYECSALTSINISNSVTSIGESAFSKCKALKSITIPNSVASISANAFTDCEVLEKLDVDSENKYYDSRNNCNAIIETASNKLIIGCKNSIIPDTVSSIGNYAFYGCTGLKSITIPGKVTDIGGSAFDSCTSLSSVTISDGVTSIGTHAFYNCKALRKIYIPSTIVSIDDGCTANGVTRAPFAGCSSALKIYCEVDKKPSTWDNYWNIWYDGAANYTLSVTYGVTRDEYEAM